MARSRPMDLTLAESGALALADAAADLDHADDAEKFITALEHNRRVWQAIRDIAERHEWQVPDRELAEYALKTTLRDGRAVSDERVLALIDINRRVSAELARGDDIERIRKRAYFIWESRGRPQGQDLEHWLLAEMELKSGRH